MDTFCTVQSFKKKYLLFRGICFHEFVNPGEQIGKELLYRHGVEGHSVLLENLTDDATVLPSSM